MCTPQSDEKRERLCFIEHKDKSFVSNHRDFSTRKCSHFSTLQTNGQKHGSFFSICPLFLSSPSSFSFPSPMLRTFVFDASAWCSLAHDTRAGERAPAPCALSKFHFFAFTHHLQPTELLLVRGEGFCISTICSGG